MAPAIYTIGHSTRPLEEFSSILVAFSIGELIDIRRIPRSRKNPQYNSEALQQSLSAIGMTYTHARDLGGLRRPRKDSVNTGWRNESFRGYADYMQSAEFESALERLVETAAKQAVATMCAEAVPWRCHRSLLADALFVRGVTVHHIMDERTAKPHVLTSWAHVEGLRLTYPAREYVAG